MLPANRDHRVRAASGWVLASTDLWQLTVNIGTTIITSLMVF
ncbi:low affinity iron permease family protein [Microvirga antarctica]|nr:low affinity iron permease family protein [Microvirga antarctica]